MDYVKRGEDTARRLIGPGGLAGTKTVGRAGRVVSFLVLTTVPAAALAAPTALPLATIDDLTGAYQGAFKVEYRDDVSKTAWANGRLAYNPDANSVFIDSHRYDDAVAEFQVPEVLGMASDPAQLPKATMKQGFTRVLDAATSGNPQGIDELGGMAYINGELVIQGYRWNDVNGGNSHTTVVVRNPDSLATSVVDGYFELEGGGTTLNYVSPVPELWQGELGATHLAGSGGGIRGIQRTSVGPSLYTFNPAGMSGDSGPVGAQPWLGYTVDTALSSTLYSHEDSWGSWDAYNHTGMDSDFAQSNTLWTHISAAWFGFIVPGTRTFAVIGHSGMHESGGGYGITQWDGNKCHGTCPYDPNDEYPYIWLYDLNDILAASAVHEPIPYDYGRFDNRFPQGMPTAGAFDPASGKLFLLNRAATKAGNGGSPVIAAYQFQPADDPGDGPGPGADTPPSLAFTDLTSGPGTGLGDGRGDGAIVTVWGNDLGDDGGRLVFEDSTGAQHEPYVYYWKNADGTLPSGPANLFASHGMQEIAFSIPAGASQGAGKIYVEQDGHTSNALPFTVRSGNIYHVKADGSDSGDGSWASPWRTVTHADDTAPAGSTIYVHDVDTGDSSSANGIFWSNSAASSTLDAQFAITAYPGFQPSVTAQRAIEAYTADALVVSKLDLYASNYTAVDSNGQPTGPVIHFKGTYGIRSSKNGRAVANRIGDIPGGCASKTQGAIMGNAKWGTDRVSNFKVLGNEIYDYGCNGSSKLHHTTYMSIRSDGADLQVAPWEFGYNYLHGNKAKFGIHQFDQNDGCGDTTGPIRIYNNVIVDQAGAGISVGSQCDWSMDVEIDNNVLINVGLAADWDGVDPDTSNGPENGGIAIRDSGLLGTMHIRNNLVYGYSADGQTRGGRGCLNLNGSEDNVAIEWRNNVCYTQQDQPFVGAGYRGDSKYDNVTGSHNIWHYTGSNPSEAVVPAWGHNHSTADPLLSVTGARVSVRQGAPVIDQGLAPALMTDIYGRARDAAADIGPIEYHGGSSKNLSDRER